MTKVFSRRSLMAATVLGIAGFSLAPAMAEDAAEVLKGSGSLVVSTWGGTYVEAQTKAFFQPFTEATGIEVITTGTPDAAKLKLMEQSGNVEWDLLDAEGQMMLLAAKDDLIQKVDYDLVHKIAPAEDLITETLHEYGFPSVSFGWVLAWNTEKYAGDAAPHTWVDFWDVEKFPGRRALYANPRPLLEIALLADGVERDKLYPLDVDRAFKKLDEIKPHIDIWVENTGQYDVLMQNNEVDIMLGSHGRSTIAKEKGLSYDYTMNDGMWQQSFWIVPKHAPNAENAMKLIAWMAQPENEAEFVKMYPYGMPNKKAYDLMSDETKAKLPTAPENLAVQAQIDPVWWTENLEEVNRRWLEWYSKR